MTENKIKGPLNKWQLHIKLSDKDYSLQVTKAGRKGQSGQSYWAISKSSDKRMKLGRTNKGDRPNWLAMWKLFEKKIGG